MTAALRRPAPVRTIELFGPDRAALLELLGGLSADDWARPTACAGWSVKDVALHMLGVDLANLSRRRDRFSLHPPPEEPLVPWLNRVNEEWVAAARRLSPRVLVDLLGHVGPQVFEQLASLDPSALGAPVSWAGPDPAPVWLDVAREYTERWHHQQHIRDAVGRPGQREPRFLAPVLATFARALPGAYADAAAPAGTAVVLRVDGPAGGAWSIARGDEGWSLWEGEAQAPAARVGIGEDDAWRLFTRGIEPPRARRRARVEGDAALAERLFGTVAIIA